MKRSVPRRRTYRPAGPAPEFIPLTQEDLDQGISPEKLQQIMDALDVDSFMSEMYRLAVQRRTDGSVTENPDFKTAI